MPRVKKPDPAPERETTLQQVIREYMTSGGEYVDDLKDYQYTITLYQFNKEGRAVRLAGRTFTDLENIHQDIGSLYVKPGTMGRFRAFVTVLDQEGNKIKGGFVRVEDVCVQWDGEPSELEDPEDDDQDDAPQKQDQIATLQLQIRLKEMEQAHEMRMKEAELRSQEHIAALNSKGGGGGIKVSEMMQLINHGAAMASGRLPIGSEDDPGGGGGGGFLEEMAKALIPPIVAQVMTQNQGQPPAQAPPSQAVVEVPVARPRIPPIPIDNPQ